jgi:uncharacterized membrane protein
MNIASGTVLGLAALVSAPALWQAYTGQLPVDQALTRYLIAVVCVWAALSVVMTLVGSPPSRAPRQVPKPPGEGEDRSL